MIIDKLTYGAYDYYRASHSKFTKDTSKDGVRNFASAILDDFLLFEIARPENKDIDFSVTVHVHEMCNAIDLDWCLYNSNGVVETDGTVRFDGVDLKIYNLMPNCSERQLEMIEDLMRLVYKYEIGCQKE